MMNNTTKVSPRNGVDFSRIRKASQGTKISKLSYGGITHLSGTWYDTIFQAFRQQMMEDLARAKTPEEKLAIVEKYNSQLAKYAQLRPRFTNLESVDFDLAVKDYQDLINGLFGFVNQQGINNGYNTNRYKFIGSKKRIGTDRATDWKSDGWWAGQTLDRTTLGYKGDWDEESDAFKAWQKALNDIGMETYLDEDNAYKLRLLKNPPDIPPTIPPGETPEPEPEPEPTPKKWNVLSEELEEEQPKHFRLPTFPLFNGALKGIADYTNKQVLDTSLKYNPTLREFTPEYYRTHNAFATRSKNNQVLQERKWQADLLADNTSDFRQSMNAKSNTMDSELLTKLANNELKERVDNLSDQYAHEVYNRNRLGYNLNANQNKQILDADRLRRLNSIAEYQSKLGQTAQENVIANYTDWKSWNRNNALQDYADWQNKEYQKVLADLLTARDKMSNFNVLNSQAYKDFWASGFSKNANGLLVPNDENAFIKGFVDDALDKGYDLGDENMRWKYFQENMNNSAYKDALSGFLIAYNKEASNVENQYIKDRNQIETRWGLTQALNKPINFDGEVTSGLYYRWNPLGKYTSIYKLGGRFLAYLEHNRRAEKDIRDTTMRTLKNSQNLLRRDLDALDRESLLLLRAIFK